MSRNSPVLDRGPTAASGSRLALSSAAISDKPTGSHAIDCLARKNSSRLFWRLEKYRPTPASIARYKHDDDDVEGVEGCFESCWAIRSRATYVRSASSSQSIQRADQRVAADCAAAVSTATPLLLRFWSRSSTRSGSTRPRPRALSGCGIRMSDPGCGRPTCRGRSRRPRTSSRSRSRGHARTGHPRPPPARSRR